MRRLLLLIALLACSSVPVLAGPNAGGTIFFHDANLAYTTDITDYCGLGTAPTSCQSADVRIDDNTPHVWKLYAAFASGTTPRLKAVAFGIHYATEEVTITAQGPCGAQLELTGPGWPAPDTGTSVVYIFPKETTLAELYWFGGYWYNSPTPAIFASRSHPDQGGNFADDSVPAILDPIAGYGTIGFGEDGVVACPEAPPIQGACCAPDGTCTVTSQQECTGQWQGPDTNCEPNPCVQPATGACCVGEVCTITTQTECSGTWQGAGTVCDPNPCITPPPTGACCAADGTCTITTQAACTGTWQGAGTVCEPNPCPQPATGACCVGEVCSITTQEACQGQWLGPDTVCDPNPCLTPPPTGACCLPNGTCTVTTEQGCAGGTWQGPNTVCEPNPCPQPPEGACCFPDGTCRMTTQEQCQGGNWLGQGTSCEPNPCGVIPTEKTTWGQIKNNYR